MNFILNDIIVPDFLNNGVLEVSTNFNNTFFDTLVVDATLPQDPVFYTGTMDVFADGAVYFKNKGKRI